MVGDRLFFSGEFGDRSLWTSDGTQDGTTPVKTFAVPPFDLTAVDDVLFFRVARRLWTSDGTLAGTVQLGSVDPASSLTSFQGEVFFVGNVGTQVGAMEERRHDPGPGEKPP